ncbi:MAG: PadR family transcriptional regulator [Lachnospiraceae bacterium]|jgi:DNA-binding PadR family transcriptional regulator|nr:PadR family transcriptional regulator [Lachnospiraceae bacterium]
MENIILSLLLLKSTTIYEMRTYIQKVLSTVCSDSLGSMQIAIKKLLEKGYVSVTEYVENNTLKKQYSITPEGVEYYKTWAGTPINIQKMKSMEVGKIFFLGIAPGERRVEFLKSYIADLEGEYEKLLVIKDYVDKTQTTSIERNTKRIKEDPALVNNLLEVSGEKNIEQVVTNIDNYQVYMLEYGLERMKADLDFYKKILKRELKEDKK